MCCRADSGSASTQLQHRAHLDWGRGSGYSPTQGAPQRRVLVVSERGGIPPPPRHTSHRPGAHAARRHAQMSGGVCGREPRRRNYSGRLPFPEPRDSAPTFPPLSGSTRRELSACERAWCASAGAETRGSAPAQLKMRAGRRCHPLKTRRAGNSNEPCCGFLPARGAVLIAPWGPRH